MSDPKRGELWFVNFSPTKGHEQRGDRPALIISDNRLNSSRAGLVLAVPLTTTEQGIPWHVQVQAGEGGLQEASYALCEQVRSISKKRLRRRLGKVRAETITEVEDRLQILFGL